jgi:hypothetical protein
LQQQLQLPKRINAHIWLDYIDHQRACCAIKHPFGNLQRAWKLRGINNTAEYAAVWFVDSLLYLNAFTETRMPSIINFSIFRFMGFALPGCIRPATSIPVQPWEMNYGT